MVAALLLIVMASSLFVLLLHLALPIDEGPLSIIYPSTDFIRLFRYLLDGVPAQLINKVLVEASELTGVVLIPLLFVCSLLFCVN